MVRKVQISFRFGNYYLASAVVTAVSSRLSALSPSLCCHCKPPSKYCE